MSAEKPFRVVEEAPLPIETPADRFLATCELHDLAVAQIEARLRRERPGISDAEIDLEIRAWLSGGDPGPGTPRPLR